MAAAMQCRQAYVKVLRGLGHQRRRALPILLQLRRCSLARRARVFALAFSGGHGWGSREIEMISETDEYEERFDGE